MLLLLNSNQSLSVSISELTNQINQIDYGSFVCMIVDKIDAHFYSDRNIIVY